MHRGAVAVALLAMPVSASAWPGDHEWQPLTTAGVPVEDAADDATGGLDLVGDPALPAASWFADDDAVFLRMRLSAAPAPGPALTEDAWGFVLDADADDIAEGMLVVRGSAGDLVVLTGDLDPGLVGPAPWADAGALGNLASDFVRLVEVGDGTVWLDLTARRSALSSLLGVDATAQSRWIPLTSADPNVLSYTDVAGCVGTAACGDLATVRTDPVQIDADGDGSTDPQEAVRFSDPADPDTDDDGLLDGEDPGPLVCDTDSDGLLDGLEAGLVDPPDGTDVSAGCFVADADPATTTDPADADSDDGGLDDGGEDLDRDGAISAFETDPNDPGDDLDSDLDGLPDVTEGTADTDGDGTPDFLDTDADGDQLADRNEGVADPDGDGLPAFRDPDADNDGIADGIDGRSDMDRDGLPAHIDTDADGDGIPDVVEGAGDFDGDGDPNHLDLDADGDGRRDANEGAEDLDCDGEPDFLDRISDDGFCDTGLEPGTVDTAPFDGAVEPVTPPAEGDFGGGCSHAGGAAWWFLLVLPFLRRRRGAVLLAMLSTTAHASSFNAQRLRPQADGWRFLVTEDAGLTRPGTAGFTVLTHHARDPLVYRSPDGETQSLLGTVTTVEGLVYVTASRWFRFGFSAPLHFGMQGLAVEQPFALGDLRLSGKVRAFDLRGDTRVQFAVAADLEVPTGTASQLVGERTVMGAGRLAVRVDPGDVVYLGAHLGVRGGGTTELGAFRVGPQLTWSAGVGVTPVAPIVLSAELDGAWWMTNGTGANTVPLEVLGTLRGRPTRNLVLTVGGGGGLTSGVSAAAWRVVAGIGWNPGHQGAS
jgi:hypothetical protein